MLLDGLIDQQRVWRVPDHALRANLHDAILEDFVTVYKVALTTLTLRNANLCKRNKCELSCKYREGSAIAETKQTYASVELL